MLSPKYKRFLKNLAIDLLDEPEKWEHYKGEEVYCYWNYYRTSVYKNNKIIKIDVDPKLILFNTIKFRIDDTVVYKFRIIPLLRTFRSIIQLRLFIYNDAKCTTNDENSILVEEVMHDNNEK